MTGNLGQALQNLVADTLPGLFVGAPPLVQMEIAEASFEVLPTVGDAAAGEPRSDDRVDNLAFDPNSPAGPYTLSMPPYPGPRRVRMTTASGDRIPLHEEEVVWDLLNSQEFNRAIQDMRSF